MSRYQWMDAWVAGLGEALEGITGAHPEIGETAFKKSETRGEMLWWRSRGMVEAFIGMSEADASSLLAMRIVPLPNEVPDALGANFSEVIDKSWVQEHGRGKIASQGPAVLTDCQVYNVVFPSGSVKFFVLPAEASEENEGAGADQINTTPGSANLDMLMDIELPITLRFGSTQMALREIAGLSAGSVIEFDRGVDEPVDVMVNGHVVARGEAVIVQGSYGIRISEIASRRERLITSSAATGVRA